MQIETSIPVPGKREKIERKRRVAKTPKPVTNAIERYKDAYKRVYGIMPQVSFDGVWIRLLGQAGVKLRRLKEMTNQLNYRAGPRVD